MAKPTAINTLKNFWTPIRTGLLLGLYALGIESAHGQERQRAYYIQFNQKLIDPSEQVVSKRAMERRQKYAIPLTDADHPVNQWMIDSICTDSSVHLRYPLKWQNAIVVESNRVTLEDVLTLPFVNKVDFVGWTSPAEEVELPASHPLFEYVKNTEINTVNLSKEDYGLSLAQVDQINARHLHKMGYDGLGVSIAIFDAGFMNVNILSSYLRLRGSGQLHLGYDLVDLDNDPISRDNHGTAVSSCMAAYEPGRYIGTAPNASFYLFRTENGRYEDPLEELNWCRAAELADSIGVDLVTSSLGYTQFDEASLNHTHADLDGKSSYVAKAARMLVERGVVVVNSAGNERDDRWKKIGTPADVKEVITVGAVDGKGQISNFSSAGLTADGRIKPDLCAMGVKSYVSSTYGKYYAGNGTSYATPILSGGISCLLQAFPEKRPAEIADALRLTARNNDHPDSLQGYGVANLYAAYIALQSKDSTPFLYAGENELMIFHPNYDQMEYSIAIKKRFLFIFKRLKTVQQGKIESNTPFTYIHLNRSASKCSKKYTVKVELTSPVDNHSLKHNDLSFCPL